MATLSKREQYAKAAMQGLLAAAGTVDIRVHTPQGVLLLPGLEGIPQVAVQYADKLIAALAEE
jgi:hypothetical protein